MILEGKKDDETICREVGVEKKTLWTVKSKLRRLGYIAPRTKIAQSPQETPRETPQERSHTETRQESLEYAPHETSPINKPSNPTTPPPSPTPTPTLTPQTQQLPQELVEEVARRVVELLKGENESRTKRSEPREEGVLPLEAEDVEVVGEKVNYKVALNPEIFWRYSVFKAEAERRGRKWDGTFSDFLDIATKDILAVYGIHPTVLSMKGKKLMVELPVEVEREQA
jgi:hypothetical protein